MRQAVSSEWCWKTRPVPAAPCCFLSQTQAGEGIRWASPDLTNCWFTPVSSDHSASASFCINLLLICCHSQNKRGKLLFLFVCLFKWLQFQTGRNLCYLVHVLKPVSSFLCVWRNVDKFKSSAHWVFWFCFQFPHLSGKSWYKLLGASWKILLLDPKEQCHYM